MMQISDNLAHQLLNYLEGQNDPMAKMLRDQLWYCLELHKEAFEHPESKGVYQVNLDKPT
jgi:hypothetical protein